MGQSSEIFSRRRRTAGLILAMLILGLLVAGVVTAFSPKTYLSTATLQVSGVKEPAVLLQSKEVLGPVSEILDLDEKWNLAEPEKIHARLREALSIRAIPDTELVQISVLDQDPELAAKLANTLAGEFKKQRQAQRNKEAEAALQAQRDEIVKLRAKAEVLHKEMTQARLGSNYPEKDPKYLAAQKNYLAGSQLLDDAQAQLLDDSAALKTALGPVTIWKRAEVSSTPARPNLFLNLFLGALAGLIAGGVLAVVVKPKRTS